MRTAEETQELFMALYEKCPKAFEVGEDGEYQIILERVTEDVAQQYLNAKQSKKDQVLYLKSEIVA